MGSRPFQHLTVGRRRGAARTALMMASLVAVGAGAAAGAGRVRASLLLRSERVDAERGTIAATLVEVAARDEGPPIPAYEWCARVIWRDEARRAGCDLEDPELVDAMAVDGWELVNVIVPFAETNHLTMAYPGNTRRLIGYFRRPSKGDAR